MGDSGIGSVYAPLSEDPGSAFTTRRKHVETVVDIGYCPEVKFIHSRLMEIERRQSTDCFCLFVGMVIKVRKRRYPSSFDESFWE
jgi:hypothetical protein